MTGHEITKLGQNTGNAKEFQSTDDNMFNSKVPPKNDKQQEFCYMNFQEYRQIKQNVHSLKKKKNSLKT